MSIIMPLGERLKQMEQDYREKLERQRLEGEAQKKQTEKRKAALLKKVRDSGVIGMLEEATGPITFDPDAKNQPNRQKYDWEYRLQSDPWRQDLTLEVSRTSEMGGNYGIIDVFKKHIKLHYQSGVLSISGGT